MTDTTLSIQNPDIHQVYIHRLLNQLTHDYKNIKSETKKIASLSSQSDDEFTFLEELELLTVDIRGYASQILVTGQVENKQQAIAKLHSLAVINIPAIALFYLETGDDYPQTKAYIRTLDYLRSLLVEYLVCLLGSH
ncbi:hypothetical protein [Calothrix sp. NIES-3974]|uniref:hypothetical protein n=1 Tax=Calothrix sp. NIES-3974 TaxID=2005462 RepID=UPI000BBBF3E8|nr:hypothetical protein [Calothrix sp. NIES-3974]